LLSRRLTKAEPQNGGWAMMSLLFLCALINVVDKAVFGLLGVAIEKELALTPQQFRPVNSGFAFPFSLATRCEHSRSLPQRCLHVVLLVTTYRSANLGATMSKVAPIAAMAALCLLASPSPTWADDLRCVSTTFRLIGKNDRVCVSAFDDPKVPGVACHVSQARTGGLSGTIGLAEDPSRFSIACRQVGPIATDLGTLADGEEVYSARTSIFFKRTHVYRVIDKKRNTLVYLAISDKLIEGSPQNAISSVPVMAWGASR
jgi:CreA protein